MFAAISLEPLYLGIAREDSPGNCCERRSDRIEVSFAVDLLCGSLWTIINAESVALETQRDTNESVSSSERENQPVIRCTCLRGFPHV